MLSGPVRVQPEVKYVAEVVVLVTSLGAKRTEFNAGKRARDLLEVKGVGAFTCLLVDSLIDCSRLVCLCCL